MGICEKQGKFLFNFFCSKTLGFNHRATASWTYFWQSNRIPAIMATEQVGFFVIGKAHITTLALGNISADTTFNKVGKAPAVLKKDNLFLVVQHLLYAP